MAAVIPYTITIPSHKRVRNIPPMLRLFPSAVVVVDEQEREDYAQVVPEQQLLTHPSLDTLPKIRNWIIDNVPTHAVVQIDDDLRNVLSMVWRRPKKIVDPVMLQRIIENGVNIAHDLKKSCFCWGRMRMAMTSPSLKPFAFSRLISSSFVIVGKQARFDDSLPFNADLDLTLQLLLKERIVLQDTRFYFDHGSIEGEGGGAQAKRTTADMERWKQHIKSKWKAHVQVGIPASCRTSRHQGPNVAAGRGTFPTGSPSAANPCSGSSDPTTTHAGPVPAEIPRSLSLQVRPAPLFRVKPSTPRHHLSPPPNPVNAGLLDPCECRSENTLSNCNTYTVAAIYPAL